MGKEDFKVDNIELEKTYRNQKGKLCIIYKIYKHQLETLVLLNETIKGRQGARTDLKPNLVYIIHKVDRPSGNTCTSIPKGSVKFCYLTPR